MSDESNKCEDIPQVEIDTLIAYFMSKIPAQMRDQLDYSPKSLDVIEQWLLELYPSPPEDYALAVDDYEYHGTESDILAAHNILHGAVFYIGEVYRRELGGYWKFYSHQFDLDYQKFDNCPVIEGFYEDRALCPYFDVLEVIDEHIEAGGTLKSALRSRKRDMDNKAK
jgi:hypothetical protein